MLVLTRKLNESIQIGDDVEIKIIDISKSGIRLGIKAPKSLMILRKELLNQIKDENLHSIVDENIKIENLSRQIKRESKNESLC